MASPPVARWGGPHEAKALRPALPEVCHYMVQPLVELYEGCMVVLKVS
jgi:hypothetical protein